MSLRNLERTVFMRPRQRSKSMKRLFVAASIGVWSGWVGVVTPSEAQTPGAGGGASEVAKSQTPVLGVAVPYAIANVLLTVLGPIIVALTYMNFSG
jgi:hypothetical protein